MFQCSSTPVNKKSDSVSAVKAQRRIFHQNENIHYFKCFAWKNKSNYLILIFCRELEIGPGQLIEEINFIKKNCD